ncbi:MAG: hypothetical protein F4217_08085 [Acidimicrobiaceae bacterium]|nr:hypothetical protein [Acidimicrobiaceae bacterium]
MEVVAIIGVVVAAVAAVVGAARVLVMVMKTSDEPLTREGVRRYWHQVQDERRERRAMKVYARRYESPLHMRLGPLQRPRFGDRYRMKRLTKREDRAMAKLHAEHRLRGTPEFLQIAGEDLLTAANDYAQRRWGAKLKAMWAEVRDRRPPPAC